MARHSAARYPVLVTAALLPVLLLAQQYTVVDVERIRAEGDSAAALVTFAVPPHPREIACDVLIAGAGPGGVAAALQASGRSHSVCLTEATDWIGGQITAGGVSALDENRFIEISGATRSYYAFRDAVRDYYRKHYRLSAAAEAMENLNPGACYVSPLCFEPRVGVAVLNEMLKRRPIQTFLRTIVVDLKLTGARIESALAYNFASEETLRFRPRFILDATETGELLPLAHVTYAIGAEARSETHEPDAPEAANPACVQSFTYTFAVERRPGEAHTITKPPDYEKFRHDFTLRLNYPVEYGWKGLVQYRMFGEEPPVPNNMSPGVFFAWRRLLARANFPDVNELALINWPRQDYAAESILDRPALDTARVLQQAKRQSLAFLYWLQHDLARDDGAGRGYPELMLRHDAMGTDDGLSKYPYIRESRRIVAKTRVVEQDIIAEYQKGSRARWFADSVGTGFYMVDIHPCGANERGRMAMPKPFQIPMSALIPAAGPSNFLPAGKNIGITHLTNGAFRLHPIEWSVGEAAATIASLALEGGSLPDAPRVQQELVNAGAPLVWFDDLSAAHPAFAAIHLAAIRGIYPLSDTDLHASPEAPVTRGEAARALEAYFGRKDVVEQGWMATDHRNWFHPDVPFYWTDWKESRFPKPLAPLQGKKTGPVTRAEMAMRFLNSR